MGFAIDPDETDMAHQSSQARASVTTYSPHPEVKEPVDTMPHDYQPPGVDEEEIDLETALTSL